MIVSKPAIVFHVAQVFFNFLAMCCFASVAAFQAKWDVGPCEFSASASFVQKKHSHSNLFAAGLTGFAIFISIVGILLAAVMLLVPVISEKYDKLTRLARGMQEVRVGFILAGTGTAVNLLLACVHFFFELFPWNLTGVIRRIDSSRQYPHGRRKDVRILMTTQMRTREMTSRTA
jgi:hypothetical protein